MASSLHSQIALHQQYKLRQLMDTFDPRCHINERYIHSHATSDTLTLSLFQDDVKIIQSFDTDNIKGTDIACLIDGKKLRHICNKDAFKAPFIYESDAEYINLNAVKGAKYTIAVSTDMDQIDATNHITQFDDDLPEHATPSTLQSNILLNECKRALNRNNEIGPNDLITIADPLPQSARSVLPNLSHRKKGSHSRKKKVCIPSNFPFTIARKDLEKLVKTMPITGSIHIMKGKHQRINVFNEHYAFYTLRPSHYDQPTKHVDGLVCSEFYGDRAGATKILKSLIDDKKILSVADGVFQQYNRGTLWGFDGTDGLEYPYKTTNTIFIEPLKLRFDVNGHIADIANAIAKSKHNDLWFRIIKTEHNYVLSLFFDPTSTDVWYIDCVLIEADDNDAVQASGSTAQQPSLIEKKSIQPANRIAPTLIDGAQQALDYGTPIDVNDPSLNLLDIEKPLTNKRKGQMSLLLAFKEGHNDEIPAEQIEELSDNPNPKNNVTKIKVTAVNAIKAKRSNEEKEQKDNAMLKKEKESSQYIAQLKRAKY